ncbi:hypothetical protein M9H77_29517 [Catharanthus roseus]|uniref:Uncharacterized protein n=1 Tax=Catharanthus roseus TaxID=4058 RepID=A0ACB9ZUN0_CATRO|nr:hypothetical protein M9H77_29517 [Catharanthus roseus]
MLDLIYKLDLQIFASIIEISRTSTLINCCFVSALGFIGFYYESKWKKSSNPVEETSSNKVNVNNEDREKKPRVGVEFSDCDIVVDPGVHKSIDSYPYEIRDELRRRYVAKGTTTPCDQKFPQTDFGEVRRSFQKIWFKVFT